MNNRFISLIVAGVLLSGSATTQTFKDKKAINFAVRGVVLTSKAIGACGGAAGGAFVGLQLGQCLVPSAERLGVDVGARIGQSHGEAYSNSSWGVVSAFHGFAGAFRGAEYGRKQGGPVAIVGGALGGGSLGAYIGWKSVKRFSLYTLAKIHGVNSRVERISQYYNINISQYKPIFLSAVSEPGNTYALKKAVGEAYANRFGPNWQDRFVLLFETYGEKAGRVLNYSFFRKNDDMREFIRLIELGAAMANLYYRTKPDKRNTINSAITLYKELGLLQ